MKEIESLFQELWFLKRFDLADEQQIIFGILPEPTKK